MSPITTHVLDTSIGRPAAGVHIVLERREAEGSYGELGRGVTDADGRLKTLLPDSVTLEPGVYRMTFETGGYYAERGVEGFYPEIIIVFELREPKEHYHVPVLLSPWGYSTYRGS